MHRKIWGAAVTRDLELIHLQGCPHVEATREVFSLSTHGEADAAHRVKHAVTTLEIPELTLAFAALVYAPGHGLWLL